MPTGSSLSPARVLFFSSDSSAPPAQRVLGGTWIFGFSPWEIARPCQAGGARAGEEGKWERKSRAGILFSLLRGPGVQGDGEGVIYFLMIKKFFIYYK